MNKINELIANFGLSIAQLKEKSIQSGNSFTSGEIVIAKGVSVKWINNPNFQGGTKNGYGTGLYAIVKGVGMQKTFLITK